MAGYGGHQADDVPGRGRWKAAWTGMGDPSKADRLADSRLPVSRHTPEWHPVRGLLKGAGQLSYITDNLLDIAHVRMVHTTLRHLMRVAVERQDGTDREPNGAIWANRLGVNGAPPPLFA